MRCPRCGHIEDKVLDSRAVREDAAIRRRRQCLECDHRFTTYEEVVKDALRVRKRDGRYEELSRLKLIGGILRACEKRPVDAQRIEDLVDAILDEIEAEFEGEVSSMVIGEKVMQALQKLDDVAYVRFASVYRRFGDITQFENTVREILSKT